MKPTRDGRVIVDDFAVSVLLGEEDAFVIGNCTGKPRVRDCGVGESGCIKADYIVPMTCETIATTECTLS